MCHVCIAVIGNLVMPPKKETYPHLDQITDNLVAALRDGNHVERVGACLFLFSGGWFRTKKSAQLVCRELKRRVSDREDVVDYGYVGEYAAAALITLEGSIDTVRKLLFRPSTSDDVFENLLCGVRTYSSDIRKARIHQVIEMLLELLKETEGERQIEVASTIELIMSETDCGNLYLGIPIAEASQTHDGEVRELLHEAARYSRLEY